MSNPLRWGNTGENSKPPAAKRASGVKAGRPEASAFMNWRLDAGARYVERLALAWLPHEAETPNMIVIVGAGALWDGATLVEVAEQTTPTFAAPTTDPRIDRISVDRFTGAVTVTTGSEATSPIPPDYPQDQYPVAQVSLAVGQTEITDSDILDERTRYDIRDAVTTVAAADSPKSLTAANAGLILVDASAGAVVLNLPAANTLASLRYRVVRIDSSTNAVTVNLAGADTFVDGSGALTLTERYRHHDLVSDGVSAWTAAREWVPRRGAHAVNLVAKPNATNPLFQIDVTADEVRIGRHRFTAVAKTADITASGAGGLDTGAEAASAWYHWWWIVNESDPDVPVLNLLLSLEYPGSGTEPTLPADYTLFEYGGAVRNDGSSNFVDTHQVDRTVAGPLLQIVNGDSSTVYTATTISVEVPQTARLARGTIETWDVAATPVRASGLLASDANGLHEVKVTCPGGVGGSEHCAAPFSLALVEAQTLYRKAGGSNAPRISAWVSGWEYGP